MSSVVRLHYLIRNNNPIFFQVLRILPGTFRALFWILRKPPWTFRALFL